MDDLVKEVIPLLQYLIPGFVSTWIFYTLTAFKRPDTFGQIVQALIFTFVIHGVVLGVGAICLWIGLKGFSVGVWSVKVHACWAFFVSVALGLCSCFLSTNDQLHGWLRRRNVTKQSSYPSEWFSTLSQNSSLITLHLTDERRVFGWPVEWPPESGSGQFVMQNPYWLNGDGTKTPFESEFLLIDSGNIKWVELNPAQEGSS
ncbi:DUF6338 family protein [Pseudomonas sp. B2M1-30]|uniref:DUF6338 family protein n=1 Tax=Pseudomonas koreensis TaxID=198620 RepID=A0A9X2XGA6_9PSED|nr:MULTISPECIES: DUF6338 family protein [Pseudomonas]MCU0120903.1 DUF6338 family protein [Pseudomonas sp. B2M1-30]MCU7248158.1 DUF6338 family protein [Pseudomonas koreensis]MCU7259908.1 DUF6338 family protein [Pseudomonas koreensis]